MLARRLTDTVWCQGVSALSLDWCQGALALSLDMSALLWLCALSVGVAVGSLHDDEPMQADEPLTVRGDAPRGLFTRWWGELQQTYGFERPRGLRSEIFTHRPPPPHGIHHMPPWDRVVATPDLWPDELILLMTSLVGLTTSGAGGQMRCGGSEGFMKHLFPPGCPYCNK